MGVWQEGEFIIQILKRRSFGWALIPFLCHFLSDNVLDGVQIRCRWPYLGWTEDK